MSDVMVVASKVKAFIKANGGMNTSGSAMGALTEVVEKACKAVFKGIEVTPQQDHDMGCVDVYVKIGEEETIVWRKLAQDPNLNEEIVKKPIQEIKNFLSKIKS